MKQKVAIWLAVTLPTWGLLFFFLPFKPVATRAEVNIPWLICTLSAGVLFGYAMADLVRPKSGTTRPMSQRIVSPALAFAVMFVVLGATLLKPNTPAEKAGIKPSRAAQ